MPRNGQSDKTREVETFYFAKLSDISVANFAIFGKFIEDSK